MSKRDRYSIYEDDGPIGDFSDNGPDNFIDRHFMEGLFILAIIGTIIVMATGNSKCSKNENTKSSKSTCEYQSIDEQSKSSNIKSPAVQVIIKEKTNSR